MLEIGQKVTMKVSGAKWYLNHPEVYVGPKGIDSNWEEETLVHLICCLGESVPGKIVAYGTNCYKVDFRISNLLASYYVDRRNFEVVNDIRR